MPEAFANNSSIGEEDNSEAEREESLPLDDDPTDDDLDELEEDDDIEDNF